MRRSSSALPLLLLTLSPLGLGCRQDQAQVHGQPIVVDARPQAAAAAPVAAPAPPQQLPATPPSHPYDPNDPLSIPSIQISGEIALAAGVSPPKSLFVYVTKGDCLADGAALARRLPVTENGTFLVHLIAMPGDEFSVCAAAAPAADGTTSLYGKAATPVRVTVEREQSIHDLKIDLRPSPPHRFPAR